MTAGLDFIVIGAGKSGTTSLFEYMRTHPELYLPPGKEHPFFSRDDVFERGWDWYAGRVFAAAAPGRQLGKVEPSYMTTAVERPVPERIAALFPNAKLIALLRDPIDRAVSHYGMEARRRTERRSLRRALHAELHDGPGASELQWYIAGGEYGRILARYLASFGRSQLLVLASVELREARAETLAAIWRFLGVAEHEPPNLHLTYAPTGARLALGQRRLAAAARHQPSLRAAWQALPGTWQRRLSLRFEALTYRFDRRRSPIGADPDAGTREALGDELLAELRGHYRPDLELLFSLVGRLPPLERGLTLGPTA